MNKQAKYILAFVLLNLFDVVITTWAITKWGFEREANPYARWLLYHYGIAGLWGNKVFVTFIVSWVAWVGREAKPVQRSIALLTFFFVLVCLWNTYCWVLSPPL